MIYPATSNNKNWKILNTHSSYYSKEYADRACKLYISDEFAETNTGKKHKYFRLYAQQPHSIEMALAYEIHCPCCNSMLKPVARMRNEHELFLYECPSCSR